jgi:hypothetical protein
MIWAEAPAAKMRDVTRRMMPERGLSEGRESVKGVVPRARKRQRVARTSGPIPTPAEPRQHQAQRRVKAPLTRLPSLARIYLSIQGHGGGPNSRSCIWLDRRSSGFPNCRELK